ncbi:hypothetical protein GII30_17140 [Gordonia amarae]|uniref:Bacteriocin biosynthesis cyclodehydratase domain-containing protein n=2 Tax=Gordonia amarae TaxID=36821 RepID=G7GT08_9ACTN|nr:hypothetical protein [Gordonia amarae]MCS3880141.1 bacteriocin biosynthesis cyclodehydratase domain-containing protein [Gordonia amarae]QHN18508.1 hypothetical protein GII35_17460 [Gordonia amarae]QHN22991.1 hypothetical protein GII34_17000 [Gordonia amarae]QHN31892.1 hypothetical protein GII32_17305 [Gordonia amarae]QHN40639.1 hypothetical protein GII30_17140 [Gordonia amarae]
MSRGIIADAEQSPPAPYPALGPHVHVITLTHNKIRIGSGPAGSLDLIVRDGIDVEKVGALLAWMRVPRRRDDLVRRARRAGLTRRDVTLIVRSLVTAGLAVPTEDAVPRVSTGTVGDARPAPRTVRVSIEGRGPLTTRLRTHLPHVGVAVTAFEDANLTILADHLVPDPYVVDTLMRRGRAHLQVRMRDGVGLIGPLVLPGHTSCLRCADHHRTTLEPHWPQISTALVGRTSDAAPAQIRATAALAQWQIEELAAALTAAAHGAAHAHPQLIDHVLELHPRPTRIELRQWTPHPLCGCRTATRDS